MWSVACTYASEVAPANTAATMQTLMSGIHWGFGSAAGALLGGVLYDSFGPVFLFRVSASLSLLAAGLSTIGFLLSERGADNTCGARSEIEMNEESDKAEAVQ